MRRGLELGANGEKQNLKMEVFQNYLNYLIDSKGSGQGFFERNNAVFKDKEEADYFNVVKKGYDVVSSVAEKARPLQREKLYECLKYCINGYGLANSRVFADKYKIDKIIDSADVIVNKLGIQDVDFLILTLIGEIPDAAGKDKVIESIKDLKDKFGLSEDSAKALFLYAENGFSESQSKNDIGGLLDVALITGDIRFVVIKLVKRLVLLRDLESIKDKNGERDSEKIKSIAESSFDHFAAVAKILGFKYLEREIKKLSIKETSFYDEEYMAKVRRFKEKAGVTEENYEKFKNELEGLVDFGEYQVNKFNGRVKDDYSTMINVKEGKESFDNPGEFTDGIGYMFIVGSMEGSEDDYEIKSLQLADRVKHELFRKGYQCIKEKDFINNPKPNGYRSYQMVFRESEDSPAFEVQIRTARMHNFDEYGDAAHFGYKDKEGGAFPKNKIKNISSSRDAILNYLRVREELKTSRIKSLKDTILKEGYNVDKKYVFLKGENGGYKKLELKKGARLFDIIYETYGLRGLFSVTMVRDTFAGDGVNISFDNHNLPKMFVPEFNHKELKMEKYGWIALVYKLGKIKGRMGLAKNQEQIEKFKKHCEFLFDVVDGKIENKEEGISNLKITESRETIYARGGRVVEKKSEVGLESLLQSYERLIRK